MARFATAATSLATGRSLGWNLCAANADELAQAGEGHPELRLGTRLEAQRNGDVLQPLLQVGKHEVSVNRDQVAALTRTALVSVLTALHEARDVDGVPDAVALVLALHKNRRVIVHESWEPLQSGLELETAHTGPARSHPSPQPLRGRKTGVSQTGYA